MKPRRPSDRHRRDTGPDDRRGARPGSHRPTPRRSQTAGEAGPPQRPDEPSTAPGAAPIPPPSARGTPAVPGGAPVVHLRSASYSSFIYQRMIGQVQGEPADGDLVAVVDKRGALFGWGFYNSRSQIVLRMFSHGPDRPDESAIASRIARAVALRRQTLRLDRTTDAYRLIHAEGDGLSGLVADRFGEYVVIELFSLAMFRRVQAVQDAIVDAGLSVRNFVVRADKHAADQEGFKLGTLSDNSKDRTAVVCENGVKFHVRLARGHKTGFFCDQRENRLALTEFTPGRRVLDVCCYTGGFSCYAAAIGHAEHVTAVDLDEAALDTARQNAALNAVQIDFKHADAFDYLRNVGQSGRRWDVVVVDPSKFVARRDLMDLGLRKYADLNRLAAGVVAPGGILLTCSCSGLVDQTTFVQTVARAMRAAGRTTQVLRVTGAGPDHPFMADTPEGAYLKAVWARLG